MWNKINSFLSIMLVIEFIIYITLCQYFHISPKIFIFKFFILLIGISVFAKNEARSVCLTFTNISIIILILVVIIGSM